MVEYKRKPYQTGIPSKINLLTRVSRLTRTDKVSSFKIGITNNPEKRICSYVTHGSRYSEMIVLYKTTSLRYLRQVEKDLISYHANFTSNIIGGGGGRYGAPPYYVYLVREFFD